MSEVTEGNYRIYFTNDSIYIQNLNFDKILIVENFSSFISEVNLDILKDINVYAVMKPHCILGILKIETYNFFVFVKSAILIGAIDNKEIFKIKEAELIPITDDINADNLPSEIKSYVYGIVNLLSNGFYYSFTYDLTNPRHKQQKEQKTNDFYLNSNKRFFWNFNLYSKFFKNDKPIINTKWMVICINGFFGLEEAIDISTPEKESKTPTDKLNFYLLSRRSVNHTGTRYLTRGIDDNGNVANFVETEQIIKYGKHIMSFIQIRGSVPIFFQQTGVTAQTEITRTPELTSAAFIKHIEDVKQNYFPMIFMINLMNFYKPNEQIITQNFEHQIKLNKLKALKYIFWDFQNECKSDNYENIDKLINNLLSVLNIFKFHCEDMNTGEIVKEQAGIIRTNCLDCLDRTNVIQTRLAWKLKYLNLNVQHIFNIDFRDFKNTHTLMKAFRNLWADNGDLISVQYSGTSSCITTVTKKGKHGIMGMFHHGYVSLSRMYQGNFEDAFKQKCIEIFLNKNFSENLLEDPLIKSELEKQKSKYITQEELNIFIGSWNVGGNTLKESSLLFEWLYPFKNVKEMKSPDIYIIGLQEICSLNAKNIVLNSNTNFVESWKNLIFKNLNEIDKYIILKTDNLVGIFLIIFVKESLKENFRNIEALIVRTGLLGTMGNKGSIIIRFNYLDTSIAVSCAHLSAGQSEVNSRISEMTDIITKSIPVKNLNFANNYVNNTNNNINSNENENVSSSNNNNNFSYILNNNYNYNYSNGDIKFKDHDIQFIFGDLNFRLDFDYKTALKLIKNKEYKRLESEDQLNKRKNINSELIDFSEGPLKFDPTYKYIPGTSEYDSKKKRIPSWCDRILFKKSENLECVNYDKVDYTHSDHKPIFGIFKIKADRINKEKKENLIKEIKSELEKNPQIGLKGSNDIESNFFLIFLDFINDNFFNSSKLNLNSTPRGNMINDNDEIDEN